MPRLDDDFYDELEEPQPPQPERPANLVRSSHSATADKHWLLTPFSLLSIGTLLLVSGLLLVKPEFVKQSLGIGAPATTTTVPTTGTSTVTDSEDSRNDKTGTTPATTPVPSTSTPTTTAESTERTIPNVVGLSDRKAAMKLQALNLQVQFEAVPSMKRQGTVVATKPAAGTVVHRGVLVTLVVASGEKPAPKTKHITVSGRTASWQVGTAPSLIGFSTDDASRVAKAAGYTLVTVRRTIGPINTVISQAPGPGKRLASGGQIGITVGMAATTTPTPTPTTPTAPPAKNSEPEKPKPETTLRPVDAEIAVIGSGGTVSIGWPDPFAKIGGFSGTASSVAVSKDGSQLVFSVDGDLYVASTATKTAKRLTSGASDDRDPSFAPDGRTVLFASNRGGDGYSIYSVSVATKAVKEIYSDGSTISAPRYSPGGDYIAFVSDRYGDGDLFLLAVGSSSPRPLVSWRDSNEESPAWAPDGDRIAFSSDRGGNFNVYVVAADLSFLPRKLSGTGGEDRHPSFSPDGKQLAFDNKRDVYVMGSDGRGARRIGPGQFPSWGR